MNVKKLVELAEAYGTHRGLTLVTVGSYAAKDGKFFKSLKEGTAGCTVRRAESVTLWFHANWPADLEWPDGIARPTTSARRVA